MLDRVSLGSDEDRRLLITLYSSLVLNRYIDRCVVENPEDRQDITSRVFQTVFRRIESQGFREAGPRSVSRLVERLPPRTRLGTSSGASARRKEKSQALAEQRALLSADAGGIGDEAADENTERAVLIRQAIEVVRAEFEPASYEMARLQLLEGSSAVDAGEARGKSANAAYIAKCRVKRRLRELLDRFEIWETDGESDRGSSGSLLMNNLNGIGRGDCPSDVILDRFLSGTLTALEDERINQHVETCRECTAKLAEMDGDSELETLLRARTETPVVSLQEADDMLGKIDRPITTGAAGRRANRRFRFTEREIAQGGMGVVHEGRDIEMGRTVAVKRLKDEYAADRRNIKQFEYEARVTGLLEHPGIVPVYGRGKDPRGRPFFAMRKVEGERLATAIKRASRATGRPFQVSTTSATALTVCHCLQYGRLRAHAGICASRSQTVEYLCWGHSARRSRWIGAWP